MLVCAGYWCKRPAAADDGTLIKLTPLCDWILAIYCSICNWLYYKIEIEVFPAAEENEKTDPSDSTARASDVTFYQSPDKQQSINDVHEPNNEVDKTPSECAGHGQDETLGAVKSKQFVSQTGSKVANDTPNGTGSGISSGIKDSPSLSEHTNTSVKNGQFASETINVVNKTQNSKAVGVPTGVNIGSSVLGHTTRPVGQVQALCRAELTAVVGLTLKEYHLGCKLQRKIKMSIVAMKWLLTNNRATTVYTNQTTRRTKCEHVNSLGIVWMNMQL